MQAALPSLRSYDLTAMLFAPLFGLWTDRTRRFKPQVRVAHNVHAMCPAARAAATLRAMSCPLMLQTCTHVCTVCLPARHPACSPAQMPSCPLPTRHPARSPAYWPALHRSCLAR